MRIFFSFIAAAFLIATGCDQMKSAKQTPNAKSNANANTNTTAPAAKDNTGVNQRDESGVTKTPLDQGQGQSDIDVTASIRKRVVDTKLSVNAQNVKIITENGKVTLRGPVKTEDEKKQVEQIANDVAGVGNVDSQIEIQP